MKNRYRLAYTFDVTIADLMARKLPMQKALIVIGLIIVIVGLTWPWLKVFPFGQLPGDIAYKGDNFRVYFPITTMLIVSAVLSLIFWFFR